MSKKIAILGGGTFSPIRNHLSLCAPAFGSTAKQLKDIFSCKSNSYDVDLYLTKMADPTSKLVTNDDVFNLLNELLDDKSVGSIIMNAALCDFYADIEDRGFHGKRLKTSEGSVNLTLKPAAKLLDCIKKIRPDILLVGFKTTTGATPEEQFKIASDMMWRANCDLVLANDTVTRFNILVKPEDKCYIQSEFEYEDHWDQRNDTLINLANEVIKRID